MMNKPRRAELATKIIFKRLLINTAKLF
jgi:hypothetical protein